MIYFYEIKGGDKERAHDSIGIVPYIYQDAYRYYYSLWLAQQRNEEKDLDDYKPKIIEVKIPIPQRNIEKRKLFSFLDEEVEDE